MSFGQRFLNDPARFPGMTDNRNWGDDSVTVNFAGGPYRFSGLQAEQRTLVEQRFRGLCTVASGAAAVHTGVFRLPGEYFRNFDTTGWEYSLDLRHQEKSVEVAGLGFAARIELDTEPLRGYLWTAVADDMEFVSVLENFFRIVTAYRLLQLGGVLLHSSGVLDDGMAYLFFGHSNAGKTTVARLSAGVGHSVLSDDINALHRHGDGTYSAEKMPFAGELGPTETAPGSYPVQGLYRLQQAQHHELQAIPAAIAVASLAACAPYVNADPYRQPLLLANLERIVLQLPVQRLLFAPDPGFWPILKQDARVLA